MAINLIFKVSDFLSLFLLEGLGRWEVICWSVNRFRKCYAVI